MSIKRLWRKYQFLIMIALIILTFPTVTISRLKRVINVVAPVKTVRIKNNTTEWFDGENCRGDSQMGSTV